VSEPRPSHAPTLERQTAFRIFWAGCLGVTIAIAACLYENLSDEQYFATHFIIDQTTALAEASHGDLALMYVDLTDRSYLSELADSNGYAFRITDKDGRIVASSNESLLIKAAVPTQFPGSRPDFWVQKFGDGWFEVGGGMRHRINGADYLIEFATAGDPAHQRYWSLAWEFFDDVWRPMLPIMLLMLILVPLSIRQSLRGLKAAARALQRTDSLHSNDERAAITPPLPREVALYADATEQLLVRAKDGVEQQRALVGRIAHRLKTALAIMVFELGKIEDKRARSLEEEVHSIGGLVRRVLAMSRLDAGASRQFDRVDLLEVAQSCIAYMRPLAESKNCVVALYSDRYEDFDGDLDSLSEAIVNLIENAIVHSPSDRTTIRITCGPGARIVVEDSGKGLPLEQVDTMFMPYRRGETDRSGTGLGLAIVKRAVDLHKGTIEVSRSDLGGAAFTLTFGSPSKPNAKTQSQPTSRPGSLGSELALSLDK
jgi:signal transduction histidine kinase